MGQANVGKAICRLVLLAGAPPVALNELLHMARVLDTLSDVAIVCLRQVVLNSIASPSGSQLT